MKSKKFTKSELIAYGWDADHLNEFGDDELIEIHENSDCASVGDVAIPIEPMSWQEIVAMEEYLSQT